MEPDPLRPVVAVVLLLALGAAAWLLFGSGASNAPDMGRTERGDATDEPVAPGLRPADRPPTAKSTTAPADANRPASTATYRFHVVADADGRPVAGASIFRDVDRPLGTTDVDGRLEVQSLREAFDQGSSVAVRREGFGLAVAWAKLDETCEVRLTPAAHIVGTVVLAETGAPVPLARVRAFDESSGWALPPGVDGYAVPDAEGRFRIEGTRQGSSYRVVAHLRGRATATKEVRQVGPETRCDFRLEEGGILEGTVFDGDGRTIAEATVTIAEAKRPMPPDPARSPSLPSVAAEADMVDRTITDERGRYRIVGLPLARSLVPFAESTPLLVGRGDKVKFRTVGQTESRDVHLPFPGALTVIVEGLEEGSARLVVHGDPLSFEGSPRNRGTDGAWRFEDVSPGAYDVRVFSSGQPFVGRPVDVVAGATAEVRISFRGNLAVEGAVVTEDGRPLPKSRVWWSGETSTVTEADDAGHFRFGGLDEAPGTLTAAPAGRSDDASGRTIVENVKPGGAPLRVVIGRAARLRMRCEGAPQGGGVGTQVHAGAFLSIGPPEESRPDGTIEVRVDVLGVPVEVTLHAGGYAVARLLTLPLVSGEVRDLGVVRFEAGRDVELRVVDADGAPCPGAVVAVAHTWAEGTTAKADASGVVRLPHMPRRAFSVLVTTIDAAPHLFPIPDDGTGPFDVRLGREGTLEVHVVDRKGAAAPRARVRLLPADEDPFDPEPDDASIDARADDRGLLTTKVQARAYRIHVRSAQGDGKARLGGVFVRPDETTSITVALR